MNALCCSCRLFCKSIRRKAKPPTEPRRAERRERSVTQQTNQSHLKWLIGRQSCSIRSLYVHLLLGSSTCFTYESAAAEQSCIHSALTTADVTNATNQRKLPNRTSLTPVTRRCTVGKSLFSRLQTRTRLNGVFCPFYSINDELCQQFNDCFQCILSDECLHFAAELKL